MSKTPSKCGALEERLAQDLKSVLETPAGARWVANLAGAPTADNVGVSVLDCGETMLLAHLDWTTGDGQRQQGPQLEYSIVDRSIKSHSLERFVRSLLKNSTK